MGHRSKWPKLDSIQDKISNNFKHVPIQTDAAYNSHLFYLKMGMIPQDQNRNYIYFKYGQVGFNCFELLSDCKSFDDLCDLPTLALENLVRIYGKEKKLSADYIQDELTLEELYADKNFLFDLKEKTCSYMSAIFIPSLLTKLEDGGPQINTRDWTQVQMVLSEQGKARWLDSIDNKKPFVPFREFEHLEPYMNEEQKARLDKIIEMHKNPHPNVESNAESMEVQPGIQITEQYKNKTRELKQEDSDLNPDEINRGGTPQA